jgi:hypothetical protein
MKAFTKGVTPDALRRTLSEDEINTVDHGRGFRPSHAYDGFLETMEVLFERVLCAEEIRANGRIRRTLFATSKSSTLASGKPVQLW